MSAKEMFENLGYKYKECYFEEELYEIDYLKNGEWIPQIHFSLDHRCVRVYRKFENEEKASSFDMELLQAINQQCRELGWI